MYAWVFNEVFDGEINQIFGPNKVSKELFEQLKKGEGKEFRMLDDDNKVYGQGKIIGEETGFEPLDDYGTPGLGCTQIQYKNDKNKWETL